MTLSTASSSGGMTDGYISPRTPLHALVSHKKKEKIWAGEYIDLSSLQEEDAEDICLNLRTGAMSSTNTQKKRFLNIEQWTDAFNIFASVRWLRFPAEAEGLAAYMNLIRRIAHDKGSWYFYDTTFRKLKQTTNRAWDVIDNELFILALSRKQQPFLPGRESDSTPRPASRRIRSCHKFNRGIQCNGCAFPHVCRECGKPNHPQFRCWTKAKKPHLNPLNKPATGPKPPLKHQQLSPVKPQTPVNPTRLEYWLQGYSPTKTQFLLSGFKHGFKLGYEGPRGPQSSPNLKSALAHPAIVTDKIQSEITAGRISGPHPIKPLPNLKLSPLGIVPKKKPGEYRLIHHLSYPRNSNQSVNSHIPDERATVSYAGIQEAIAKIKTLGRGCHMSKTDIVSAYRICPINTVDHELLGFSWEGQFYFDLCLPFGARSACQLFEEVSTALEWIAVNKLGCRAVVHILDDFLFINTTKVGCSRDLAAFISMCTDVGIPIAEDKTFSANTSMSFVGISLCSLTMEASLPEDKLRQCQNMLRTFLSKNSCRLRELSPF